MPTTMLSPHFTLDEMIASQTASRMGLNNMPDATGMNNLKRLCNDCLEKIRDLLGGKPILISSGYRGPEVNKAVGGSTTSAHMVGLAADFTCPGFGSPEAICKFLNSRMASLGIDQLIWEYDSWVHVGLRDGEPRNMALTIDNSGTRTGFA
jgi:zinc D-Ala-D-Ala carboxypeptidase